jgi:hypothetical protein
MKRAAPFSRPWLFETYLCLPRIEERHNISFAWLPQCQAIAVTVASLVTSA